MGDAVSRKISIFQGDTGGEILISRGVLLEPSKFSSVLLSYSQKPLACWGNKQVNFKPEDWRTLPAIQRIHNHIAKVVSLCVYIFIHTHTLYTHKIPLYFSLCGYIIFFERSLKSPSFEFEVWVCLLIILVVSGKSDRGQAWTSIKFPSRYLF